MEKPKLLDEVHSVMRLKHYSLRTEDAYLHHFTIANNECHSEQKMTQQVLGYDLEDTYSNSRRSAIASVQIYPCNCYSVFLSPD